MDGSPVIGPNVSVPARHRSVRCQRVVAAAAGIVLFASACTGSGSARTAIQGKPVRGGDLVIVRGADSQSMNNTTVFDNESIWVFEQIFEPLYTVRPDGQGVVPLLATGYALSPNKRTYTFSLRHGVTFSNGRPMTSADVKFSLDRARAATQGWGYIDAAIKDVKAPAPSTVVVNLKYPWAPILADLSMFNNAVIPVNYGGQSEAQFYKHPVGTGPFKWGTWNKGTALKLVRNPSYWQPGKPYLDSVTWNHVPDDNTRKLQLRGGQAQLDEYPAWSTVDGLKSIPGISVDLFNSTRADYLLFNERRASFKDVHVRRAISFAIDQNALIKAVLYGHGAPANSFLAPRVPFYSKSTPAYRTDLAAAKRELVKSSFPTGFRTTMLIASGDSDAITVAQIVQAELKPLGIRVSIQQLDPNTLSTDQQTLRYDMSLFYWSMDMPDPDELVNYAVDPMGGAHSMYTSYNNPVVVNAARRAEHVYERAARQRLYNNVQNVAARDAFLAPLYYQPFAWAQTARLHGFMVGALGNYHLEDAWLAKG